MRWWANAEEGATGWSKALRMVRGVRAYVGGYDANDNMTKRVVDGSGWILTYDAENRLTRAQTSSNSATFTYDGDGNRIKGTSTFDYQNLAAGAALSSSGTLNHPEVTVDEDIWADSGSGSSREFSYTSANGLQWVTIDLGRSTAWTR